MNKNTFIQNTVVLSINNPRYSLFETTGPIYVNSFQHLNAFDTIPIRVAMAAPLEKFREFITQQLSHYERRY